MDGRDHIHLSILTDIGLEEKDSFGKLDSRIYGMTGYMVDGQALEPTAFGYDYENQGKWAPLDKAVIKQNIAAAGGFGAGGFYLPFNPAATGVNYSAGATVTNGNPSDNNPTSVFDLSTVP